MVERIRDLIDDAVRLRLISDVPLGAFLSGGLDSSTIVAMMRKHNPGKLQTFTIGYEDATFSEMEYAKVVADHFGTEHRVLIIDKMDEASVEKSIWHLDEPMTDLSSIPLMFICQKAKPYVTVCLSGEGGDEVFVGYDRFKAAKIASFFNVLPQWFRRDMVGKWAKGLEDRPEKKGPINMFKRFVEGSLLPEEAMHLRWQYFMDPRLEQHLFSESFQAKVPFDPFARVRENNAKCTSKDVVNRQAYLDTRFMMSDSVLMKADKMSMASALEIRVPLLDHRLVEYMGTVPGSDKLRGMTTKYIFRKALDGILPKEIVWRGKQGYSLPVKNLLRTQLKDFMVTLLHESPLIREDFDGAFVDRLIDEHLSMKQNHNHVLVGPDEYRHLAPALLQERIGERIHDRQDHPRNPGRTRLHAGPLPDDDGRNGGLGIPDPFRAVHAAVPKCAGGVGVVAAPGLFSGTVRGLWPRGAVWNGAHAAQSASHPTGTGSGAGRFLRARCQGP